MSGFVYYLINKRFGFTDEELKKALYDKKTKKEEAPIIAGFLSDSRDENDKEGFKSYYIVHSPIGFGKIDDKTALNDLYQNVLRRITEGSSQYRPILTHTYIKPKQIIDENGNIIGQLILYPETSNEDSRELFRRTEG